MASRADEVTPLTLVVDLSIETVDLPGPVRDALDELGGLSPAYVVDLLRHEARARTKAAASAERSEEWEAAADLHTLAVGYIRAALRIEHRYGSSRPRS